MYLFFGLSGFLITVLLVEERVRHGAASLGGFFVRRALRLLPGLVAFLAVWLVVVALFGNDAWMTSVPGGGPGSPEPLSVALQGVGAALGYLTNWVSVFHLFSGYVPLGHLWSLAVEEQFYLLWAPLLLALLAWRRRAAGTVALVLAIASTGEAIALHAAGRSYWTYVGTGTRSGAFLLGAALALAWSSGGLRFLRRGGVSLMVAAASLAALFSCASPLAKAGTHLSYAVAWSAATVAGPVLVVSVVDGGANLLGRALSGSVITYLGRRSYALYLWHYVFLTWLRSLGVTGTLVALGASLAAAELSWRLVEAPALRWKERLRGRQEDRRSPDANGGPRLAAVE